MDLGKGFSDTLAFMPAVDLARMIREKEISSVELTRYFIDRIERYDETINAVVVRDFDRALSAAARADEALMRGDLFGPLHGLPMTVKEAYNVAGLPTTWGDPRFRDNTAVSDSAVVASYKASGAHILGKTNVPILFRDAQSYNDIYGTTNNPWNLERTPGGSSGGSAAALAAGLTGLESGTDIAGSIRGPAHCCGVYGHKPTRGIVSREGFGALPPVVPDTVPAGLADRDLDVAGPLARSAEDLGLALDIIAGPDRLNAAGWRLELPAPRAQSLRNLRVAVWATDEMSRPDTAVTNRVQMIADLLAKSGAQVSDTARPKFSARDSHYTYLNLLGSNSLADVSDEEFAQLKSFAQSFDADDMSFFSVIMRAASLDHRSWDRHNKIRTEIRLHWKRFFEDWDILICPTMVTTASPHDHSPQPARTILVDGTEAPYWDQIFWTALASVAYLPSTVFPTGPAPDGLPIGLQAIGAEFADRTTIEFAQLMAREIGGFRPPPSIGNESST